MKALFPPGSAVARLLLLLPLVMMVAGSTAPAQPVVAYEQYRLDNGLTVILHEDHSAPVAAAVVVYHVGSKNERPGRTGFAHLFEHMMFQGSKHVGDDEHFKLLQEIGGNVNGSTNTDRTNYFEVVPSNHLELALYLEADRMGFLLDAMTQEKLDNQRDVVKNERRQNYDNQPYGTAWEKTSKALYPEGHPYSWPVIGYMEDLDAASLDDVMSFFRLYYAPNNACLAIAGDIVPSQVRQWVEKYFGPLPSGGKIVRPGVQTVTLPAPKRIVFEDKVQLPRLYLTWPSPPMNTREDAVLDVLTDILSAGKNSRLYKTLVYEKQIAQSVSAYQYGQEIAGQLGIDVTAKPDRGLTEIETAVRSEISRLLSEGVTDKEIQTSLNNKEADIIGSRSTALGKANALATYHALTGDAAAINRELERFQGITPVEVLTVARRYLDGPMVALSVVPRGKPELAAEPQGAAPKGGRP